MTDDLAEIDAIIARLVRLRGKMSTGANLPPAGGFAMDLSCGGGDGTAELREWCRQRGHLLTDDCLDEVALGDLIGVSPYTLRNERQAKAPRIRPRKIGNKRFYAITDIAEYLKSK